MKIYEAILPFSGFYNSIHDAQLDQALEYMTNDDSCHEINKKLSELAFDSIDWKQTHLLYAKYYTHEFADLFGLYSITFKNLLSPKYYNFETDRILTDISHIDVDHVLKNINMDQLRKCIKDRFTSRDGFISHYPNTLEAWGSVQEWDHNQIGTLLTVYANQENSDFEYTLLDRLDDKPFHCIDQSITNERPFKLLNYLQERKHRANNKGVRPCI